jgi:hypothetical protein
MPTPMDAHAVLLPSGNQTPRLPDAYLPLLQSSIQHKHHPHSVPYQTPIQSKKISIDAQT